MIYTYIHKEQNVIKRFFVVVFSVFVSGACAHKDNMHIDTLIHMREINL